jgi:hypothetical protein
MPRLAIRHPLSPGGNRNSLRYPSPPQAAQGEDTRGCVIRDLAGARITRKIDFRRYRTETLEVVLATLQKSDNLLLERVIAFI